MRATRAARGSIFATGGFYRLSAGSFERCNRSTSASLVRESNRMDMAFAGHASTQAAHFEHSGMLRACGSSCSGHTVTHVRQSLPCVRKHPSPTRGRRVRLPRDTNDSSALMGHRRVHHLRSTSTSMSSMAGNSSKPHVVSLKPTSRHSAMSVAKTSPTGHTRQNTGNPNAKLETSAPASTT